MELTNYITQLLHAHDCVIVPQFGGFIANYRAANVDWINQKISPPTKTVLFNSNLIQNDGLLGNAIAADKDISYPTAVGMIDKQVKTWQTDLAKGKRVEIGELGFLFKVNHQIVFEQSREMNILLSAYGLSEVSFVNFSSQPSENVIIAERSVAKQNGFKSEKQEEGVVIVLNPTKKIEPVEIPSQDEKVIPMATYRNARVIKYLGVAAAIPLLFYSYWIPMQTDFIDTGKIQFADFNPIHKAPERQYQMRVGSYDLPAIETVQTWEDLTGQLSDDVTIYNYQFDEQLYIPIRLDKNLNRGTIESQPQLKDAVVQVANENDFHVIAGCFSIKENAENLILELKEKGYQASLYDFKGGLYRVSMGNFVSETEAESKLATFKANGFSGWILKK